MGERERLKGGLLFFFYFSFCLYTESHTCTEGPGHGAGGRRDKKDRKENLLFLFVVILTYIFRLEPRFSLAFLILASCRNYMRVFHLFMGLQRAHSKTAFTLIIEISVFIQ